MSYPSESDGTTGVLSSHTRPTYTRSLQEDVAAAHAAHTECSGACMSGLRVDGAPPMDPGGRNTVKTIAPGRKSLGGGGKCYSGNSPVSCLVFACRSFVLLLRSSIPSSLRVHARICIRSPPWNIALDLTKTEYFSSWTPVHPGRGAPDWPFVIRRRTRYVPATLLG